MSYLVALFIFLKFVQCVINLQGYQSIIISLFEFSVLK